MRKRFSKQIVGKLRGLVSRGRSTEAPPPAFIRVAYCVPRQVVLLTARHAGADNVWPVDWHGPLSQEPELYGIAVNRSGYGTSLIRASGTFVVNMIPATWEEAIFFCGRTSGRTMDKLAAAGLRAEEAACVDAPLLLDALGNLECRVEQGVEAGDHTLFIGRVLRSVYRADAPRLHHLDSGLAAKAEAFE